MKKIVFSLSVILISLVLFSCKSKEVQETPVVGENGEVVVEAKKPSAKEEKKKKETEEKKKEEKTKKEEEKKKKEEEDDRGLFGWIDTNDKNPSFADGLVKIKTDGKLGTFCIYAIDEKGKETPVFSPLNEFSSTSFYLKAGNKKYKLHRDKNVKTAAKALDNGVALLYSIDNVADVNIRIEVFPTVQDSPADTIKFTAEVVNRSKQPEEFGLKVILDTVLGERRQNHFYTYENTPITSEFATRETENLGYFTSKNEKASMQLLFNGGDTTIPSFFALAGYSKLEGSDWEPNMHTLGAFDTVLSYNNSAVCTIWPDVRLANGKSSKTVFYLSLGLYENTPNGYRYVYGLGAPEKVVKEEKTLLLPNQISPTTKTVTMDSVVVTQGIEKTEGVVITPVNKPTEENQKIEFNVDNIEKDHLTPEYVQSLINRISELEQNGAQLNRSEILQLNAELDAILTILKK